MPDPEVIHRWESYCYRKIMPGVHTHEEYENIPALDVQWDFALATIEVHLKEAELDKRRRDVS
jgi:hypothetical protein